MIWNDAADEILRRMWPDHTASQIGKVLKTTKNSVLGRADRMKKHGEIVAKGSTANKWKPEYYDILRDMNAIGRSDVQIGKRLGVRASTISSYRRQMCIAAAPLRQTVRIPQPEPLLPDFRRKPAPNGTPSVAAKATLRPFADLRIRDCRKPMWGDRDKPTLAEMIFCGAPTEQGHSYCAECEPALEKHYVRSATRAVYAIRYPRVA